MKNILFIHDYPPINGGGLAINVNELISELNNKGNNCILLTSRLKDNFNDDTKVVLDNKKIIYKKNKIVLFIALIKEFRKADIVINNFTFSFRFLSTVSLLLSFIQRKKMLFVFHTLEVHLQKNRFKKWTKFHPYFISFLKTLQNDKITNIVFSNKQVNNLNLKGFKNIIKMPMPVLSKYFHEDKKYDIIYLGELSDLKNIESLEKLILEVHGTFKIRIIGDGEKFNYFDKLSKKYKNIILSKTVCHRDALKEISKSKFLFFPCKNDSWGRVVFESFLQKTMVITSDYSTGVLDEIDKERFICIDRLNKLNDECYDKQLIESNFLYSKELNDKYLKSWLKII